jgi:hypothetical protein
MSKIIATAHIALSVSAAILLDVRYVQAMEFRVCLTPFDAAAACGEKCRVVGSIELRNHRSKKLGV